MSLKDYKGPTNTCEILQYLVNEKIVAVKKGNIIGVAFHPELTEDVSLHKYFVNLVKKLKN